MYLDSDPNPHRFQRQVSTKNLGQGVVTVELGGISAKFCLTEIGYTAELILHAVAVSDLLLLLSTTAEESKALGVPLIVSDIPVHRERCEGLPADVFAQLDNEDFKPVMREAIATNILAAGVSLTPLLLTHTRRADRMVTFSRDYSGIVNERSARIVACRPLFTSDPIVAGHRFSGGR